MDLTATDRMGDPPGAARVRAGAIRIRARGGEDGRPRSTALWRRRAHLGRRSEGGPGVDEASLALDARSTLWSLADEALCRPSASDRPGLPPSGAGAVGVVFLAIYRLVLLCVALGEGRRGSSSSAFIPTGPGVGRPAPGHAPIVPALAKSAHAAEDPEGAT
jgi:hypothetical protein